MLLLTEENFHIYSRGFTWDDYETRIGMVEKEWGWQEVKISARIRGEEPLAVGLWDT
jgi:hypothetical protein